MTSCHWVAADCIKPTNPEKRWRTLFSFHLITGWTLKCDLNREKSSLPRRSQTSENVCFKNLNQITLSEDFFAFKKKNVICGLMITRHSTDISSQTLLDNRKVQEIHKSNNSPWGIHFVWPGNHTLSPVQKKKISRWGRWALSTTLHEPDDSLLRMGPCEKGVGLKQNSIGKTLPFELLYTFLSKSKGHILGQDAELASAEAGFPSLAISM